jgi:hypothetical protein
MQGLEKGCNKFQNGSLEFSPITGIWIRCLQAYHWIQPFHETMVAHVGNLFQTCKCLNILSPGALTPTQVILNINECMMRLDDLKKDMPNLWNIYLRERLALA